MILTVMPIAKKKLEDRAVGVQRSKKHGDTKEILSVFFVENAKGILCVNLCSSL